MRLHGVPNPAMPSVDGGLLTHRMLLPAPQSAGHTDLRAVGAPPLLPPTTPSQRYLTVLTMHIEILPNQVVCLCIY